jgi:hypothetical protein
MTDPTLDILRQAALIQRLKSVPGGPRIAWSAGDIAQVADHVARLPETTLRSVAPTVHKLLDDGDQTRTRKRLGETGVAKREILPTDSKFVVKISSSSIDLSGDRIFVAGWDMSSFKTNPVVLAQHDNSAIPVATSSLPWVAGDTLMAIAIFPPAGTSTASDEVATAIRAGLLRAASVGLKPGKFAFSKDPARPLGVDFISGHRLLEWSFVSIPANSDCLIVGAVNEKSASLAPKDGPPAEDASDWQCRAVDTMPIDSSDNSYDAVAAKAEVLAKCTSSSGAIFEKEAQSYFLAVDITAPLDPDSYKFPFCRVSNNIVVAAKTGWRQSLALLENSDMPGLLLADARALTEKLEARLGDAKSAVQRRQAAAQTLIESARTLIESLPDPVPTREQRLAAVRALRREIDRMFR